MKIKHILLFFISIQCATFSLWAQETSEVALDTLKTPNQKYGIRLGVDILKLGRTALESGYNGFEVMGDVRFSKRFYAAAEVGFEDREYDKDNLVSSTNGSYIKIGSDFNAYRNWLGMNNAISAGLRYGFSTFSQELISYPIYTTDTTYPTPNLL